MEDHQGKEVANEVFPQTWLASELIPHSHRITPVFINQVGAEGAIGFSFFESLLPFHCLAW